MKKRAQITLTIEVDVEDFYDTEIAANTIAGHGTNGLRDTRNPKMISAKCTINQEASLKIYLPTKRD